MVAFETASQVLKQKFLRSILMQQSWIHKNLRLIGSPAIKVTAVASSRNMSDLCVNFEKPSYNPNFGLSTQLDGGRDQREQKI